MSVREESLAMALCLERRLINAVLVPAPSFGPKPNVCIGCGRPWRGLDADRRSVCCGIPKSDLWRHAIPEGNEPVRTSCPTCNRQYLPPEAS